MHFVLFHVINEKSELKLHAHRCDISSCETFHLFTNEMYHSQVHNIHVLLVCVV